MIAFSGVQRTALPVRLTRLLAAAVTPAGQSIVLFLNTARIVVSIYEIAAGATLREHKHPFVRYAYVLTSTLRVTNTQMATATSAARNVWSCFRSMKGHISPTDVR